DQNADRPPVLEFDRADCRHELAHAVVRGMAHVDAEDVGAGPKQAGDDGAVGGRRTEGGDDLGPAQASHQSMIPKSGSRFPAFAKPASAGEGRSEKIMLTQ